MAASIPTNEPTFIVQGTTVKWTKDVSDYKPEDGWTLHYMFAGNDSHLEFDSTDNGDSSHLITISATASSDFTQTLYHWQCYAIKSDEKYLISTGTMKVKPTYDVGSPGFDSRTHAEKMVAYIESVIESRLSGDEPESYGIKDRNIQKMSINDLTQLRDYYKEKVRLETSKKYKIQFRF